MTGRAENLTLGSSTGHGAVSVLLSEWSDATEGDVGERRRCSVPLFLFGTTWALQLPHVHGLSLSLPNHVNDFNSQGGFVVCLLCESLFPLHPQCDDNTHSLPRCLSTAMVLFSGISRCLLLVQNISQTSCCLDASSSHVSLLSFKYCSIWSLEFDLFFSQRNSWWGIIAEFFTIQMWKYHEMSWAVVETTVQVLSLQAQHSNHMDVVCHCWYLELHSCHYSLPLLGVR